MISVLVTDDHPLVRRGIQHIVAETPDIKVAAEASTGHELLDKVGSVACDAIVLDLMLPDIDGLDLLKQLRERRPSLPVVVLTLHCEDHFAVRALKAGAAAYVTKDCSPEILVEAVRAVVAGRKYISPTLSARLVDELGTDADKPSHESLSDREYQILGLIGSGRTVSEIAASLSLSVKTVSTYRSRILEKMRLRTNADLTAYAIRNRLIE